MSDSGWAASTRWAHLGLGDFDFTLRRETSDRQVEHFLDAPPKSAGGLVMQAWDGSQNMTARVANFQARWERQKGRFVTLSVTGNGTGVAFAAPTLATPWEYGVTLPPELIPAEDAPAYCPALVEWNINPALVRRTYGALTRSTFNSVWLLVCIQQFRTVWGANATDTFAVHATFPLAR